MNYDQLLPALEDYVRRFFAGHEDARYVYHNIRHTERVVAATGEIANHFQLDEQDFFTVMAAAWFHDTGYFSQPEDHEAGGAALATDFLRQKQVDGKIIEAVTGCILATRLPQSPENLLEKIVCDADLYHLGTDNFNATNKRMRREKEALSGKRFSGSEWRQGTIRLLQNHHYHTEYCQLLLSDTKDKNLKRLMDKEAAQKDKKEDTKRIPGAVTASPAVAKSGKEGKKRPDKGIETMFRVSSSNNQRLSNMADNKAHIMITVNSIILSAIISLLLRKLDNNQYLTIPTFIILAVCVATIIFSILATRPTIPKGKFTRDEIAQKKVNLLFFGNFYKMSLEAYTEGMWQVMDDRDFLYGSLIQDVYAQGVVLGRKYKLLRISYNIFMFGLIISVLAFIIATILVGD